jgi:hypothetical protein
LFFILLRVLCGNLCVLGGKKRCINRKGRKDKDAKRRKDKNKITLEFFLSRTDVNLPHGQDLRLRDFMNEHFNKTLSKWHEFVETQNAEILDGILDENVKFHSPFVWKPKDGKALTTKILTTVTTVFENFYYVREIFGANDWALEFEAKIGELTLRGIDLIKLDDEGKIVDFEVMIRPANALQILGMEMSKRLGL